MPCTALLDFLWVITSPQWVTLGFRLSLSSLEEDHEGHSWPPREVHRDGNYTGGALVPRGLSIDVLGGGHICALLVFNQYSPMVSLLVSWGFFPLICYRLVFSDCNGLSNYNNKKYNSKSAKALHRVRRACSLGKEGMVVTKLKTYLLDSLSSDGLGTLSYQNLLVRPWYGRYAWRWAHTNPASPLFPYFHLPFPRDSLMAQVPVAWLLPFVNLTDSNEIHYFYLPFFFPFATQNKNRSSFVSCSLHVLTAFGLKDPSPKVLADLLHYLLLSTNPINLNSHKSPYHIGEAKFSSCI